MIEIRNSNPTPRWFWHKIYSIARDIRNHGIDRQKIMSDYLYYYEWKYNIDSDYLMETMGKYALSIT